MPKAIALRPPGGIAAAGPATLPLVFVVLLLALAASVFTATIPPLADYVNHLARMHVLAGLDRDPVLAAVYEVRWAPIPNLLMDLVVPPMARVIGVFPAGQVFVFLTQVALVTGPMAVHRALFGRFTAWPLVAFLFVYNGIFLYGLMNYLFGIGIAAWGVALWLAARDRPHWQRALLSAALVLALFFCHLFAVGLYGLALFSVELSRWAERRRLRPGALLADVLALGVPFLPVIPLLLASPTMGLSKAVLWEARGKLDGLFSIVQLYGDVEDLAFAGAVVAGGVWLLRRGMLRLHNAGWALLCLGAMIFLAMPRVLFGSWLADQRMPVAVLFLVIGFLRPAGNARAYRPAFYAALLGISVLRFADLQWHWHELGRINDEMRASAAFIAPGSPVLVAHADQPWGSLPAQQALSHGPCVAVIERDALVSTLFTVPGKQVLDIRAPLRDRVDAEDGDPPTVSQLLATADEAIPGAPHYWDYWPGRYRYLYILYTHPGEANPDRDRLDLLFEGQGFQLYEIKG